MNAERLLAHYEKIADAPDAIPRLRCFILDLAVRGKLVEQDPEDETAAELLMRIAEEKAKLVFAGKFRTFMGDQVTFPFPIPANWAWCHLDDLAAIARGGSPRPIKAYLTDDSSGIPWIKIGDSVRGSIYINQTKERIRPEGLTKSRLVRPGDLLLSNSMSFGYPYITKIEGCIHDGWLVIRTPEKLVDKLYLHILFRSSHAKQAFSESASGAVVQNLNTEKVRKLSVPLPPLSEQHHIVAKVNELMTLCERLEAARTEQEETRDRLAAGSLARLNAPKSNPAVFREHATFALENLIPLTTRSAQIKAFRQTILNLAVRGKLVEQDPADEPASELLKRIAAEQAELVRRKKRLPDFMAAGLGKIPNNWCTVPLIALGQWAVGSGFRKNEQGRTEGPYFFLKVSDMNLPGNEKYINTANNYIDGNAAKRMKAAIHPAGTIIFPKIGGAIATNKRRILTRGSAIDNNCLGIIFSSHIENEWAYFLMRHFDFTRYQAGTAVPALQQGTLAAIPVALPPLAEQRRIVSKVDELMAFCDRMETGLAAEDAIRTRLLDSLLHEALGSTFTR